MSAKSTTTTTKPSAGETETTLVCPNCGTVGGARTNYCSGCGQRQGDGVVTLRALIADLMEDTLALDGRLPRTLSGLLRPGHLTREYAAGRIARYVRPFKLYLACSVIFFVTLSFSINLDRMLQGVRLEPGSLTANRTASVQQDTSALEGAEEDLAARGELATEIDDDAQMDQGEGAGEVATSSEPAAELVPAAEEQLSFGKRLEVALEEAFDNDPRGAVRRFVERFLDDTPKAVFVLLPIFAIFLKLLYIRRLYVEHIVFVLHLHSFAFLLATLGILIPGRWPMLLMLVIPFYILWAMKRVYGQGWLRTIFKFFVFGWLYWTSVFATLAGVAVLAAIAVGGI